MTSFVNTPRIARSKSGADLLFDRMKQEQFRQDEKAAIAYLNTTLDISLDLDQPLHQELKDGVLLCNLVNKIKPGTIRQVGQKDLSFIKMDNITRFLQGARQLGLNNAQLFETIDLFEAKDMAAVIHTILAISRLSEKQLTSEEITNKNAGSLKQEEDEENDLITKYRDVRDIFGGFDSPPVPHRPRPLEKEHHKSRSRQGTHSFSRPPKSPLRPRHEELDRRMSSPAAPSGTKRHSHTFPHNKSTITKEIKEQQDTPIMGGSLGHKLDRQYRETANDLLAKKPSDGGVVEEDKLLVYTSPEGVTSHYQLGNCIGKGQFGSVYRALDLSTGEIVAVKRLPIEDGELDGEIMREVALLKTLAHANVVQYIGFIQSEHSMNIILEYAENGSLMSTLKAFGAFPEKLVASFCIKILNGLDYLHQNDVVHCDLKAANILTTKTGDVKLTDFGISLNLKIKGADAGSVSGTPNWMAPEVIELKGASTKSDIWSLGCTLMELLTGKPPYADLIAMSAMFRIVEDDLPPLPENISDECKSFLTACFQKDPQKRLSAAELKNHAWIIQNGQRIRKTETYSHDLSSYLQSFEEETPVVSSSDISHPNESQVTLIEEEEEDEEERKVPLGLRDEEDYITHRFIHTSFGKVVECKVCGDLMNDKSIFCQVCALICHEECKKSAFSCPPKVNDQQASYDWVFSAKIYNRGRKSNEMKSIISNRKSVPVQLKPEDAESIRQYALALGLTPQEEQALNGNQALLSHTLSLQQQHKIDPGTLSRKGYKSFTKDDKKKMRARRQSEECIIS